MDNHQKDLEGCATKRKEPLNHPRGTIFQKDGAPTHYSLKV